ncbi:MAG: bifunctional phosphoribosylaminoimidazolecarboxamide formyltransferase/IMP cyclohydrolase, partial [Candidatus Kerfeldbacteria bacterium]
LISVSDKNGVAMFAKGLHSLGWEIVSTGGTARTLRKAECPVREVSDLTGFPEILDGRVKTLHPGVLAGVLAKETSHHRATMSEHGLAYFEMVVCNLYPFQLTVANPDVTWNEAIEQIDIGGPTMLRAAAKNHDRMIVVVDPVDYNAVFSALRGNHHQISGEMRHQLACKVFEHTAAYDVAIAAYMRDHRG